LAETIALVGGETLLGRDVVEVFGESSVGQQLRLVAAAQEEAGKLTVVGDTPSFLTKLDPDALEDAAIVILAGSRESSKEAVEAKPSGLIIDLTGYLEDNPDAQLRSPLVETGDSRTDESGPQIVAHPAATAIALILARLHRAYPIARAIVHIFEPASERGKAGIEELQQQTVKLFAFQTMPKKVFDAQAAFNMLPQWGEEAPGTLLEVEERIERHLASLLERMESVPMPSLRLIQVPVFHGYTFSFWVDFEENVTAADVEETLMGDPFDLRTAGMEAPGNVGMAGQSGIAVGAVTPDRNSANAIWIWAAADNLRIAAESAALIARESL
jgi:aspartate-semialdehyde dehydrogenase